MRIPLPPSVHDYPLFRGKYDGCKLEGGLTAPYQPPVAIEIVDRHEEGTLLIRHRYVFDYAIGEMGGFVLADSIRE